MRVTKDRCEVCKKETDDRYAYKGWIKLNLKELTVSNGRDQDGHVKITCIDDKECDFCSTKCFNSFFKELTTV